MQSSGASECTKQHLERFLPGGGRPIRLFVVSHETRTTGAMFVREVGAGEVFTQVVNVNQSIYALVACTLPG